MLGSRFRLSFVNLFLLVLGGGLILLALVGAVLTLSQGRITLEAFQNLLIAGIALGSVYALIAMGYTLVYGILFMINFAHGEVFMWGAFTAFFAATALDDAGVAAVVRRVLDRHGLVGPFADVGGVEVVDRINPDGVRHRFVLHHGSAPVTVTSEVAGTDLLTGRTLRVGDQLTLSPTEALVLS